DYNTLTSWAIELSKHQTFLKRLDVYEKEKLLEHIKTQLWLISLGANDENKLMYYRARTVLQMDRLESIINSTSESFLKSLRQIAGFYWYCENNGTNYDFNDNADLIVKKYGYDSGKKAKDHYRDF